MSQFDNVNIGLGNIEDQIRRFRRQLAEQLQALVNDGEASPDMSVEELIVMLRSHN